MFDAALSKAEGRWGSQGSVVLSSRAFPGETRRSLQPPRYSLGCFAHQGRQMQTSFIPSCPDLPLLNTHPGNELLDPLCYGGVVAGMRRSSRPCQHPDSWALPSSGSQKFLILWSVLSK